MSPLGNAQEDRGAQTPTASQDTTRLRGGGVGRTTARTRSRSTRIQGHRLEARPRPIQSCSAPTYNIYDRPSTCVGWVRQFSLYHAKGENNILKTRISCSFLASMSMDPRSMDMLTVEARETPTPKIRPLLVLSSSWSISWFSSPIPRVSLVRSERLFIPPVLLRSGGLFPAGKERKIRRLYSNTRHRGLYFPRNTHGNMIALFTRSIWVLFFPTTFL